MIDNIPELRVGDIVSLICDPKDNCVVDDMLRFDGCIAKISHIYRPKRQSTASTDKVYECEGIKSRFGVPYSFLRDMLIPEEDEDE